jgi:hypothetical protein
MKLNLVSMNHMECKLDEGEDFYPRAFAEVAITRAQQNESVWNVDLLITSAQYAEHRIVLLELEFFPAGVANVNGVTYAVVRKSIRSGDGLAVRPTFGVSAHEREAIASYRRDHPEETAAAESYAAQHNIEAPTGPAYLTAVPKMKYCVTQEPWVE